MCSGLLFGNDINIKLNEIGKEILLMEITKTNHNQKEGKQYWIRIRRLLKQWVLDL